MLAFGVGLLVVLGLLVCVGYLGLRVIGNWGVWVVFGLFDSVWNDLFVCARRWCGLIVCWFDYFRLFGFIVLTFVLGINGLLFMLTYGFLLGV